LTTLLSDEYRGVAIDSWTYPELRYWAEYSGQYDNFRDSWIERDVQLVSPETKADADDVNAFLGSDLDVLLLRSGSLLPGIQIPSDVEVVRAELWNGSNPDGFDPPVLLVRKG
jgi:hypothetical protein